MLTQTFALLLCFMLQAAAIPYRSQASFRTTTDGEDGCPTGVHVIGIRGTLEAEGFGAMENLAKKLLEDIPGSNAYPIDYPANGIDIGPDGKPIYKPVEYIRSVNAGRRSFAIELDDFNAFCPNTSIVVMAYSQGAQVAGDVICGSTLFPFGDWDPIQDELKANIKAFVTLGRPEK